VATLDEWTEQACAALGLEPDVVDQKVVLDLARDVAHAVARPAAPLGAYILGVAVGRGASAADTAARMTELANSWPAEERPAE
jgi:Domain of unknown function (DUF6457)